MKGHTDKQTINDRRPMSDGTRATLKRLVRNGSIVWGDCDNGTKNQLRALMDRGYALPENDHWYATKEGKEAIA